MQKYRCSFRPPPRLEESASQGYAVGGLETDEFAERLMSILHRYILCTKQLIGFARLTKIQEETR